MGIIRKIAKALGTIRKGLDHPSYAILFVLIISFLTYFTNYAYPPNLFWDENYHIASAEKYINGVFFMEPHPPLGKLFIAAGELLLRPNKAIDTSTFIHIDYIRDIPAGYSFAGVRLFPTLFAVLAAPLFFLTLYLLTGYSFMSFLFTGLYLFENAFIVHSRGAMLESIQMFFILGLMAVFAGALRVREKVISQWWFAAMGVLFGLAISTKLNAMLFVVLPLMIIGRWIVFGGGITYIKRYWKYICTSQAVFVFFAVLVFVSTYYIHITIATRVLNGRYYEASKQYQDNLKEGRTGDLSQFPLELREQLGFIPHYEKGVPEYDYCKPGENGSLPIAWLLGNKSINYRWELDGNGARYLYLQGNPVIWLFCLVALLLTLSHVISVLVFGAPIRDKARFYILVVNLLLYLGYMAAVISIKRVMYLYHYFIPLMLCMVMGTTLISYLFEKQLKKREKKFYFACTMFILLVVAAYVFFSPLTYYSPLTHDQFLLRSWLPIWRLEPVN